MSRNCGHLNANQIGKFTHAPLAAREFLHDEQPGGVRESFDDSGLAFVTGLSGPNLVKSLSESAPACMQFRPNVYPSTTVGDIPDAEHPSENPTSPAHRDPPMQIDRQGIAFL